MYSGIGLCKNRQEENKLCITFLLNVFDEV